MSMTVWTVRYNRGQWTDGRFESPTDARTVAEEGFAYVTEKPEQYTLSWKVVGGVHVLMAETDALIRSTGFTITPEHDEVD